MIKEVRKHYGFSQKVMATYLGVSRSQLAMAEKGVRDLKSEFSLKVISLYNAMHETPAKSLEPERKLARQKKERKSLEEFRLIKTRKEIKILEKKLEKITVAHKRSNEVLNILNDLFAKANKRERIALEVLRSNTALILSKTGEDAILKVQIELARAQGENEFLEKRKKNMD